MRMTRSPSTLGDKILIDPRIPAWVRSKDQCGSNRLSILWKRPTDLRTCTLLECNQGRSGRRVLQNIELQRYRNEGIQVRGQRWGLTLPLCISSLIVESGSDEIKRGNRDAHKEACGEARGNKGQPGMARELGFHKLCNKFKINESETQNKARGHWHGESASSPCDFSNESNCEAFATAIRGIMLLLPLQSPMSPQSW